MKLLILGFFIACSVTVVLSDYFEDEFEDYVPFIGLRRDEFDWKLMKAIIQNDSSNFIISPFSVKVILMLLAEMAGLGSPTLKELLTALDNLKSTSEGRSLYYDFLTSLKNEDADNEFRFGNIVVVSDKLDTSKRTEGIFLKHYYASVNKTDLTDVAGATKKINDWVANLTENRIKKIVERENIADSVVTLLNVLYFEGHWKVPFKTEKTNAGSFKCQTGQSVVTDFMTDKGEYYYFESPKLNSKILRMPYAGHKYAMYIILPNEGHTTESVAPLLDHKTVNREAWYLDLVTVDLKFPKFSMNYAVDLKPYLQGLGIKSIFSNDASLPGLARGTQTANNRLVVSSILQKAGIDVNEEGSTAAAATEAQLVNKIEGVTKQFHANRPFLYYIEDDTTGNILFAGQVLDPSIRN